MTIMTKERFGEPRTEKALLKITWEGEILGVGLFETLTEMHPEHAEVLTACTNMEWLNTHLCEDFCHEAGIHITPEGAERLYGVGARLARKLGFEGNARLLILEAAGIAGPMYKKLSEGARSPELRKFADGLFAHEYAMRDWMKSELDGRSDGGAAIFSYLERHGITREEAVTPRKQKGDAGGDRQELVLASFSNESQADQAARLLRNWERASEHMKVGAIGVLVKDSKGKIKQHKLGKQAGRTGMGVGVALGLIAALPTAGLSLAAGAIGGAVGGGIIGRFFHKGLKLSDEAVARLHDELDAGQAVVGVLAWNTESESVRDKLRDLGAMREAVVDLAEVAPS